VLERYPIPDSFAQAQGKVCSGERSAVRLLHEQTVQADHSAPAHSTVTDLGEGRADFWGIRILWSVCARAAQQSLRGAIVDPVVTGTAIKSHLSRRQFGHL